MIPRVGDPAGIAQPDMDAQIHRLPPRIAHVARAMGFGQAEVCAHGFRSTASTLLNEQGVAPDLIELQLAHEDKSSRAVYNRSKRLADRRVMLQGWADYLDNLR